MKVVIALYLGHWPGRGNSGIADVYAVDGKWFNLPEGIAIVGWMPIPDTEHLPIAEHYADSTVESRLRTFIQDNIYIIPDVIRNIQIIAEFKRATFNLLKIVFYRWISRFNWRPRLERKGKPYRKHMGSEAGVNLIPGRIDIDERPAIVDEITELGHWEGDTVYGQVGYLVTLVERASKLLLARRVPNKNKRIISRVIKRTLKPYQAVCKTITFDNGGEFADRQSIARKLDCNIYFAKPYHSWERGFHSY